MAEIAKLEKKLAKLERKAENLQPNTLPFKRIMKSFLATEKKLKLLRGDEE